jgi:hypothetical protein
MDDVVERIQAMSAVNDYRALFDEMVSKEMTLRLGQASVNEVLAAVAALQPPVQEQQGGVTTGGGGQQHTLGACMLLAHLTHDASAAPRPSLTLVSATVDTAAVHLYLQACHALFSRAAPPTLATAAAGTNASVAVARQVRIAREQFAHLLRDYTQNLCFIADAAVNPNGGMSAAVTLAVAHPLHKGVAAMRCAVVAQRGGDERSSLRRWCDCSCDVLISVLFCVAS